VQFFTDNFDVLLKAFASADWDRSAVEYAMALAA